MNRTSWHQSHVQNVESVIEAKFRTEPFHNLFMLAGMEPPSVGCGGTCSDKSLSLQQTLREGGADAFLHVALIKGRAIHRLVRVEIDGLTYYADVGNGWPSLKLYPRDVAVAYTCFGMRFRTEVHATHLGVHVLRRGRERHTMDIPHDCIAESDIQSMIRDRFAGDIEYPFQTERRFSLIVDSQFRFLRGEVLETYDDSGSYGEIAGLGSTCIAATLRTYFGVDHVALLAGREWRV